MLLRILKGVALTTAVAAVSVVALGAAVAAKRSDRMLDRDGRVQRQTIEDEGSTT